MVKSSAANAEQYLEELPPDRREVVSAARELVLSNLPAGYEESVNWGMLSYEVPLSRYPSTYNGQPLTYVSLAAQKRHYALYLMNVYADSELERMLAEAYASAGRKLDMGKSCLRFRSLDELEPQAIG